MELSSSAKDFAIRHYGENMDFSTNEAEYRQNRNDIPNIYCRGCEYGSIDILLGFGGSIFIYLWDFDRCRFEGSEPSFTLVGVLATTALPRTSLGWLQATGYGDH
jgi:hypothetical protein